MPRDHDAALGDPDANEVPAVALLPQGRGCSAALSRQPSPAIPLPSLVPARRLGGARTHQTPADVSSTRATAPAHAWGAGGAAASRRPPKSTGGTAAAAAAQRGDSAGRNVGVLHG